MSADEPQAPPSAEPSVRLVEIDLSQLFGDKSSSLSPVEICAAALAIAQLIDERWLKAPRDAERILACAWESVQRRLEGHPSPFYRVHFGLLSEYFRHAGDWAAIRRCLTAQGEKVQTRAGQFAEALARHLARVRQEYAEHYGGGAA